MKWDKEFLIWCGIFVLGFGLTGAATSGWRGFLSNTGFALVGVCLGRALR